jgi:hypothetical protein
VYRGELIFAHVIDSIDRRLLEVWEIAEIVWDVGGSEAL